MAKGEVLNTYANASGIWHAEVETAEGSGPQEVYGCSWETVRKRAAKAIQTEINVRQAQSTSLVKVDYLGMFKRGNCLISLFQER